MRKHKCLALFSGGLDSMLAVAFMKKLGYEVQPIFFSTPFFGPEKAVNAAKEVGSELLIHDITDVHIKMIENPKYGFGKFMNPCIDCHGLMFREAGKLMKELNADFLISGEVLGQRPMSQRKDAMNSVGKLSLVKELLVRPLSQKLLADTLPVREGWVVKEEMLDIQGRNRKRQMQMAKDFGIKEYATPGGGCLLTDAGFSRKLKDLSELGLMKAEYIKFLRFGRHLRFNDEVKVILGRNNDENEMLTTLAEDEIVLKTLNCKGPVGVISSTREPTMEEIKLAASALMRYVNSSDKPEEVGYGKKFVLENKIVSDKMLDEEIKKYLI